MSRPNATVTVSEFIGFLFKTQMTEALAEDGQAHDQSGVQLKTFRSSTTPVYDEYEDVEYWGAPISSPTSTLNRSRFSSEGTTSLQHPTAQADTWKAPVSHSRHSSTSSTVSICTAEREHSLSPSSPLAAQLAPFGVCNSSTLTSTNKHDNQL